MKIFIYSKGHHKNEIGLKILINYNKWITVNSIEEADIIFSF